MTQPRRIAGTWWVPDGMTRFRLAASPPHFGFWVQWSRYRRGWIWRTHLEDDSKADWFGKDRDAAMRECAKMFDEFVEFVKARRGNR